MFLSFANVDVGNVLDLLWHLMYDERSPSHKKGSKPPTAKPEAHQNVISQQPPSFFALIIGINKYISDKLPNLGGAIADSEAVKDYLQKTLGVPASRIKTLYDEQATHDGIVENLRALKDVDTKEGDPILIFYAGHGTVGDAPKDWAAASDEKIEMLAPHDTNYTDDDTVENALLDRTIGVLLEDLAKTKGDNITVIFDCCNSGSLSRGKDGSSVSVREFKLPQGVRIPSDHDKSIWGGESSRGTYIPTGFLKSGLSSHVLLAACSAKEFAKEENGRGRFTTALLATLSDVGADKVTYTDLIHRLPILPAQNPQCEGVNRSRIVFDAKAPSQHRHLYTVSWKDEGYVIDAGAAHGITEGAIFEIYKDKHTHLTTPPLGTMTASLPGPFTAVLRFFPTDRLFAIGNQAFALQIQAGKQEDLSLYVPFDQKFLAVFQAIATEMQVNAQRQIKILTDEDLKHGKKPDLGIAFEADHIVFDIKDPNVTVHGLHRMPHHVRPITEHVSPVISAAAHYYWHLRRVGHAEEIQDAVEVEFTRLSDDDSRKRKPCGPNLIEAGVVDIVVNEEHKYGMKITNDGGSPLYASVFYFDNSNFSIVSYYEVQSAKGRVDPCIPPKGSLTIGYGRGGAPPFAYGLSDEQNIDVGCIKIFLSTEKVDLSYVPQSTPFIDTPQSDRGPRPPKSKPSRLWHTILLTIVQRRHPRS